MSKHIISKKPIYSQFRRRPVGDVIGQEFIKSIRASGFLREPPSICFEIYTLKQAEQAGARLLCVIDRDTGTVYRATLAKLWQDGFSLSRGFGAQIGLLLSEWDITEPKSRPVQMELFA